jgi:putative FmdB family regulatory protein
MPIYVYRCRKCGEKFELLIGITQDKEELKCKKCNSKAIEKIPSGFSVGSSCGVQDSCSTGSCPSGTCPPNF